MNLERFVAVMRPRGSFEAIDLGFVITRKFWRPLIVSWLWLSLPCMVLVALVFPDQPLAGLFFFWWGKPLYDRPMLFVLSRALFGESPSWREVFRWRSIGPGLFGDLLWRRLSPHRSLTMPVTLLEGSSGAVGQRRRSLIGGQDFAGGGLTYGCYFAEIAFVIALFFFLDLILPSGYTGAENIDFENAESYPVAFTLLVYTFYYLSASLVEPFFVGGGFLLYLQRRTALEGWDVELAFRRMTQRRHRLEEAATEKRGRGMAALLLAGLLPLALLLGATGKLEAQEDDGQYAEEPGETAAETEDAELLVPPPPEDLHQVIQEIVALPDFGGSREEETWRFKDGSRLFEPDDDKKESELPQLPIPWEFLRWLFYGGMLALVVLFLLKAFKERARFETGGGTALNKKAEQRRFGLTEDPLAPIDDPAGRARRALEAGRADEALAWLYRGAFQELARRGLLPLRSDFTEDDCLRHLRRKAAGRSPADQARTRDVEVLFQEIASAWMRLAYGHFEVPRVDIARLCGAFDKVYAADQEVAA